MKRFLLIGVLVLGVLPGCHRYKEWFTQSFYQVDKVDVSFAQIRSDYIRSKKLYDGFSTVESFDVLWYAPRVHDVVELCSSYHNQDSTRDYYKEHVVMYVCMNSLHNEWEFTLCASGGRHEPIYHEPVSVDGSLKHIFGKDIMSFKRTVYRLVFDAEVACDEPFDVCICNGLYQSAIAFNKK